jgi:hypothetical protein
MPDPRCSDRPVAAARRFLARAAHRLVSAAGLILACAGPASATPFVYEISFGYWYSFFDPQFQYAGPTGTFAYDPATLVPLTPPSSPNERVTYVVGAGTALEVTTGPYRFALDLTEGPATLRVSPPGDPHGTSSLLLQGHYSSNAPPPRETGLLVLDAYTVSGTMFATNDLSTPIDFSPADIGIAFSMVGSIDAYKGLRLIPEPTGAGWVGLALALFAAVRRSRRPAATRQYFRTVLAGLGAGYSRGPLCGFGNRSAQGNVVQTAARRRRRNSAFGPPFTSYDQAAERGKRKRALALSSVVALSVASGQAGASYLITPVATPEGFSRLTGINNAGDVVGVTITGNPFVTPASGGPRLIQLPPHGPASGWAGINDLGQIVGSFRGPGSISGPFAQFIGASGFIYTDGTLTQLNVPGAESTYPTAINDKGVVAGYAFTPSFYQGFTYSNGVYTIVNAGPPSTDFGTRIYGINNAGDLVGLYESAAATIQAFIVHDGVTTLFDVPGFESVLYDNPGTEAFDVNNRGQIVGWAQQGIEGVVRGFIETSGTFDLLDFQIFGINDKGQLISRSAIATPVREPAGIAALAVALLAMAGLRRHVERS